MFIIKRFNQLHRVSAACPCIQIQQRYIQKTSRLLTHYHTLGLTSKATQSEIKAAFYKLSLKYHPDKRQGAEDKFKDIATAYEVLGNPRLRRLYDRGIISHDEDATIHHTPSHDDVSELYSDQSKSKASVLTNIDKWSREHTSNMFNRSQTEKMKREQINYIKKQKRKDSGAENIVWVIMIATVIIWISLSSIKFPWEKSKKEP